MLERETTYRPNSVTFYFDPICPWTWITSRWLVEVAEARRLTVNWRAMSLAVLNGGVENMPERFQEGARFSMRALRMIEAMAFAGLNDRIGDFYTQLGTRLFLEEERPGQELLEWSAAASSVSEYLHVAGDTRWDEVITEATNAAMRLAGPDVGSPVLQLKGQEWGFHGPVVSPVPGGEDALRVWDALVTLAQVSGFYELKHGRAAAPQLRPTVRHGGREMAERPQ